MNIKELAYEYDFLLPIGGGCQTRYQIERYLKKNFNVQQKSCFFDWLDLGGVKAVYKIIENDFEVSEEQFSIKSFLNDGNYDVYHEASGYRFLHSGDMNPEIRKNYQNAEKRLKENVSDIVTKYNYLGRRTKLFLQAAEKPLLVYHGYLIEEDAKNLLKLLEEKYKKKFTLLNVQNSQKECIVSSEGIFRLIVDNSSVVGFSNAWQGCDKEWDSALNDLKFNVNSLKSICQYVPAYDCSRNIERWMIPNYEYSRVEDFQIEQNLKKGVHSIWMSGVPLDLHLELKPNMPLVFFLNGAMPRSEDLKLPFFAGFGILPSGDVSRVCINDPSLYLHSDLGLAWYAGNKNTELQKILPLIINKIISLAIPTKVIFIGGSGGGFASLYYSRFIENSLALVWNPQTNILNYQESAVRSYAEKCFGFDTDYNTNLSSRVTVELNKHYRNVASGNKILYLQNKKDDHLEEHCKPFISETYDYDILQGNVYLENLICYFGNWGEGHAQPPRDYLMKLIAYLIKPETNFDDLHKSDELKSCLDSHK